LSWAAPPRGGQSRFVEQDQSNKDDWLLVIDYFLLAIEEAGSEEQ
jgi:hypothetical protein